MWSSSMSSLQQQQQQQHVQGLQQPRRTAAPLKWKRCLQGPRPAKEWRLVTKQLGMMQETTHTQPFVRGIINQPWLNQSVLSILSFPTLTSIQHPLHCSSACKCLCHPSPVVCIIPLCDQLGHGLCCIPVKHWGLPVLLMVAHNVLALPALTRGQPENTSSTATHRIKPVLPAVPAFRIPAPNVHCASLLIAALLSSGCGFMLHSCCVLHYCPLTSWAAPVAQRPLVQRNVAPPPAQARPAPQGARQQCRASPAQHSKECVHTIKD
jgi:hypothetical protein